MLVRSLLTCRRVVPRGMTVVLLSAALMVTFAGGRRVLAAAPQASAPHSSTGASAELAARAERAKQAMATNRFDEAVVLYREILEKLPDEPGMLMNLGMALSMAGQSREAIDPLTRALKLRPSLLPAALFLGQSYLDTGQPEQAIAPLRKYVGAMPSNAQARAMLASALLMSGRFQDAASEFRRLSQAAPSDAKSWYGLVQSYDALSQQTIEALEKTPDAALYEPLLLADALEREGKYDQAFALYKQSLEKLPRLRSTHDALARIYAKTGHADWAAQQTTKARAIPLDCANPPSTPPAGPGARGGQPRRDGIARDDSAGAAQAMSSAAVPRLGQSATTGTSTSRSSPRSPECDFRAGRYLAVVSSLAKRTDAEALYWRTRAYTELAADAFAKLAAMPPSQELHELRAELYRNQRQHQRSVEELKAALTFAPNDPRLRKELAKSLYFTRDWEAARVIFEELIKTQPHDPELPFFYGDVLLQSQQAEAAVPYLTAAVAGDPSMPTAHASLGRALVQLGRFAEAIPHLEAVLSQDEDGSIHYQLARAYQGTGQPDRAKPLLDTYQELQRASQSQAQTGPPPTITPPE